MGLIPNNTLLTLLDSIASGKLIYDNAIGVTGTVANTTAKAAQNDLTTLAAVADAQVLAELMPSFKFRGDTVNATSLYATLGAYNIWWALEKHLGGLADYLIAHDSRVSVHTMQIGFPMPAQTIMPPAVDPMATYAVAGSGSGTYTHVADIDTTQYGKAWVSVVATSTIGVSAIQVTVNGLEIDNVTTVSKTVTLAQNSSSGTTVNVGTLGVTADHYTAVTGITITGGTAGDQFKVVSRVERTISATA